MNKIPSGLRTDEQKRRSDIVCSAVWPPSMEISFNIGFWPLKIDKSA
jgi:hypothetical protein